MQNQEIKLHLAIDQEQEQDTAYWYPFVPPTTDMMYLMPQLGTTASLYIPGLKEQNAIITGSARTNGGECKKTSDPSTRYLGTEYGQEMKLAPGGIYFTAGRNDLILTFDDAEGVKISSHKGIVLEAKEEISFDSKTKVAFNAPSQILMATPTGGVAMENEIHFGNMKTIIECTDETELQLVEQKLDLSMPPSQKQPEEKMDLGSLAKYALGAVGIVIGDDPNREGTLVRQNLIFGIAAPILGVAALFVAPAVGIGLGAVAGVMAYKSFRNNEEIRQITNGEKDFMYCLNQGLAIAGVLFPAASIVTRGAVKLLKCSADAIIYVEGFGNVFGLSTMGPSIFMPVVDQINYNKAHGHK